MARCLKGYVKTGLAISEGLGFNLEDNRSINVDSLRGNLDYLFRHIYPSKWNCQPMFPSRDNGFLSGIRYITEMGNGRRVAIDKTAAPNREPVYRLDIRDGKSVQRVNGDIKNSGEFLMKLFEHVHKYAVHVY